MEDFTYHRPVLVAEAVELLAPRAGALVVDATCGGGGHTEEILRTGADVLALRSGSRRDRARQRTARAYGGRVTLRQINFRDAGEVLDELGIVGIGGALLDLGVSSRQLENAERGFSVMRNGPLDMRMDPRRELTAAMVVNSYTEEELTRLFRELGEEPAARRIASQLVKLRKTSPFHETMQLAKAVEKIVWRHGRRHPATQVFQALRMEVNDELGALEEGLARSDRAAGIRRAHRGHHLSFARRSDREKFLPRSQPRMAGSAGVAGAAAAIRISLCASLPRSRSSRAKTNSAPIHARAARSCAWPKKSDARPAPKSLQFDQRRLARALDRDHGVSGADRIDLRLSHAAALSSGRSQEGARK